MHDLETPVGWKVNPGCFTAKYFPFRGVGGILWVANWDLHGLDQILEDLFETRLGEWRGF